MSITLDRRAVDKKIKQMSNAGNFLRKPMDKSLLRLQNRAADYPPQRAGQTYVRTGTLGRRWTTARREIKRATSKGIEGRVGNNTTYGPWVQAEQFQARVHRNRWKTDEGIIEEEEKNIIKFFQAALDKQVNR